MLTSDQIQALHHASRIFEKRGPEGFGECADKFGEGIASACLITYLRCSFGAADASPENLRAIPVSVEEILAAHRLVYNEEEHRRKQAILEQARAQALQAVEQQRAAALEVARQQAEQQAVAQPQVNAVPQWIEIEFAGRDVDPVEEEYYNDDEGDYQDER